MATITIPEEQEWVAKTFAGNEFWLGATDKEKEGTWVWVTGEQWKFTNWGPGRPNNLGGVQKYLKSFANGTWDDDGVDTRLAFVVEWDE